MGKKIFDLSLRTALATVLFMSCAAKAEDMYINCTGPNAKSEQCAALYGQQMAIGNNGAQVIDASNTPYAPVYATPGVNYDMPGLGYAIPQQQVVMRDTAAPLAVSQPMDDLEELGSAYAVYKTPTGSLIVEKDVTQETLDDGSTMQITRRRETTVSPSFVDMPSISAHKRNGKIAYGEAKHDWEVNTGDSLRALLIEWGQKSGWTVVWKMDRDYILEAGVVFRGNFTEVASAIIRTFARAVPAPIGTFYKGNRVLVISTQEDDNA